MTPQHPAIVPLDGNPTEPGIYVVDLFAGGREVMTVHAVDGGIIMEGKAGVRTAHANDRFVARLRVDLL